MTMGYYFLLIGTLILMFALWAFISRIKLLLFGTRTRGSIVGVDEKMRYGGGRNRKSYYHPVIEFENQEGHLVTFTFGGASSNNAPTVGDQIKEAYDANTPEKATIHSFMGIWAGPVAAAILAGGVLYAGVQLVFYPD